VRDGVRILGETLRHRRRPFVPPAGAGT
jgi:hypothetical protein